MKKYFFLTAKIFFIPFIVLSQSVAINADGSIAHSSAMLDIKTTTKGLLIPRMNSSQRTSISSPATGLMVFDTDTNTFWYYNGTAWSNIAGGWLLNGNSGINPSTNFLGTTDNQPIRFRLNNQWSGEWNATKSNYAIGLGSLQNNTSGSGNTAMGYNTLSVNTTGINNTAIGLQALQFNSGGNNNVAIGTNALIFNSTGFYNTATGPYAMLNNTGGNSNTANGLDALYSNTTGNRNSATGSDALVNNTTGNDNTANGNSSLYSNTTGYSNVALGTSALHDNMINSNLVAIGDSALYQNYTGYSNTAIGSKALSKNLSGYNNTAVGFDALENNNVGYYNSSMGFVALRENQSGYENNAIGAAALLANTTGHENNALGTYALYHNVDGWANVAIGAEALYNTDNNSPGVPSGNVAAGYHAGFNNISGFDLTIIGNGADVGGSNLHNATAIGHAALVTTNNTVVIGQNTSGMSIGGYAPWTNWSDGRFKENINENVPGLSFITKLRPVTYTMNLEKIDRHITQQLPDSIAKKYYNTKDAYELSKRETHTGFIAQEVEELAKQLNYQFDGVHAPQNQSDHYGLAYSQFVIPLVKAVQEQQQQIEELKTLVLQLQQQIAALKKSN
jgi:hypothetical protein